jgi:hypothetical protein
MAMLEVGYGDVLWRLEVPFLCVRHNWSAALEQAGNNAGSPPDRPRLAAVTQL